MVQYCKELGILFRLRGTAPSVVITCCIKKRIVRIGVRISWLRVEVKFSVY